MTENAPAPEYLDPGKGITEAHALAAVVILQGVAGTFDKVVTYQELQDQVSELSRRPANQSVHRWSGKVLNKVIRICEERNYPPLSALVVRSTDGGVGSGFNEVLRRSGEAEVDDPLQLEVIAAVKRFECYLAYCPNVPEDAEPSLTRQYKAHIARRNKPEPRPQPSCKVCGYLLLPTGECAYCP